MFAALSNRDFRVLCLGSFFAFVAFMMSSTAQNVVAFDLSGNNRAVGFVAFGQGLAMLVFPPFGGALADRLSKKLLLLICQSVIGFTFLFLAILLATDTVTIFFLAAGSFVTGTMFSLMGPTRMALVGELVEPERRGNAAALTQVAMSSARVAGPFMGGGLLAWSIFGATGTYFLTAAIFVFVVATLSLLPPTSPRAADSQKTSVRQDIMLGVRYVSENPRLLPLVVGFFLIVTVGFSYFTVLPGFASDQLGLGAAGFGTLVGVSAIGGLLTSILVTPFADSARAKTALTFSSLGIGISLIVLGLVPGFALALVAMFLVGGCTTGFQTLNSALVLREANPAYYGRVMSLLMLAWGAVGLVSLPVGILADAIGERGTLMLCGIAVCVVVLGVEYWFARVSGRGRRVVLEQPATANRLST